MGNCMVGGMGDHATSSGAIQVTTSNGGIMEFHAPIRVSSITVEFPSHGIFKSHELFLKPIPNNEELVIGESYHLLPLNSQSGHLSLTSSKSSHPICHGGHARSNSIPLPSVFTGATYRISIDYQGMVKRSRCNYDASFWKVKLLISTEHLLEILGQEGRTEELIESVRTVAKCGSSHSVSAAGGFSDRWSFSSSCRNASSICRKNCGFDL